MVTVMHDATACALHTLVPASVKPVYITESYIIARAA